VSFARQLPERGYGAAVAVAVRSEYQSSLYALQRQSFPAVLFNALIPALSLPAVTIDEYGSMLRLADRLASLGHANMCLVSLAFDERMVRWQHHRVCAWLDYLKEHGLMERCSAPVRYVTSESEVAQEVDRLLSLPDPPTAIAFAYGALCHNVLVGREGRAIDVPGELSLATFDLVPGSRETRWCPPVTTVTPDLDRVAECALETIDRLLAGESDVPTIRVPMHINPTESIGRAPK
jgi:DNA-binding LacI/PurR family transcriptional regulator